jgi:hypothetical protein
MEKPLLPGRNHRDLKDDNEAIVSHYKNILLIDHIEQLLGMHILNKKDKTDNLPVRK